MVMMLLMLLEDALFSALAALGFALLFNVPRRALWMCATGGALAHSVRALLMEFGLGIEWSSLLVSTLVGLIGVYWSRRYLVPRPVFTIASVIPMVPGTSAFKTLITIFTMHTSGYTETLMAQALQNGLTTLIVLWALSFGLAIPSVLLYRNRPIM